MTGKTFSEHKEAQRISLITIMIKTTEWIVYSKRSAKLNSFGQATVLTIIRINKRVFFQQRGVATL
jgi:hypothetical protein